MSRLIDKDELMKALNISYSCSDCEYENGAFCKKSRDFVDACETICNAPIVSQWIPCSERLPEEWSDVLVTDGKLINEALYVNGKFECFTLTIRKNHFLGTLGTELANIIAWQPLPEPYKEKL